MIARIRNLAPHAIAGFAAVVFLGSLRFKFTNAEETQVIFGKLDAWASSIGAPGLFAQTGLFSQYVIGSIELLAATLLLVGMHPALRRLQALGALAALTVMTGAVSFHLFTPLGIDPNADGGGLFAAAVTIWLTSILLLTIRRGELASLAEGIAVALVPGQRASAPSRPVDVPRAA